MKTLQKNLLGVLLMLFSLSTFAQKNQIPITVNNCYSGYSTTLLLENELAIEENNSTVSAAPSFALQIKNRWGSSVSLNTLSYSFKISNYSTGQIVDFENFDYLDEAYIADGFSIQPNNNGYDVEISFDNNSSGSYYLIDDRASLPVAEIIERLSQLYRASSVDEGSSNLIGYTIEISNIHFTKSIGLNFEICASNVTKTVLLNLEGFQKINNTETLSVSKVKGDFHCFPNPAKDHIYAPIEAFENTKPYVVNICNMKGQIVLSQKFSPNEAIKLNQLAEGIYNLQVFKDNNQIVYTEKIIIE